jgi:hypothetical protein
MIPAVVAALILLQAVPPEAKKPEVKKPEVKNAAPQRAALNIAAQQAPGVPIVLDGGDLAQAVDAPPLPADKELLRVQVPADLVRLAQVFDADSFAERMSALEQITARKPSPNEVMALLLRSDLSNEARHALLAVLEQSIVNAPRGALGIRMEGPMMREAGVKITGLVPGMPAERVLQVGDVIREVEGKPLLDRSDLIRSVQSMPPGLEVKLTVRRTKRDPEGKVVVGADGVERAEDVAVKLRLGSTDDLNQRGDPGAGSVVNALAQQRKAQMAEARRRFLPPSALVEFASRVRPPDQPAVNVKVLRKSLAALQLAGSDAERVRVLRERLDRVVERLESAPDEVSRQAALAELDAVAAEIRALR